MQIKLKTASSFTFSIRQQKFNFFDKLTLKTFYPYDEHEQHISRDKTRRKIYFNYLQVKQTLNFPELNIYFSSGI